MKKWMKGLLITGTVLFLAGTAITAVSAVAGGLRSGRGLANQWIDENIGHDTMDHIADLLRIHSDDRDKTVRMRDIETVSKEDLVLIGSIDDIEGLRKLELEAERTAVRFEEREEASGGILVYAREDPRLDTNLQWEAYGDRAEIRFSYKKVRRGYGKAVIEVPAGYRFEELEIESEAGYMKIRNARADKLKLKAEAAELSVDWFQAGELEAVSKAGSLTASGETEHSAEVKAEAGAVDICLSGQRSEYDYEVKNAVGSVQIGADSYAGINYDSVNGAHSGNGSEEWEDDGEGGSRQLIRGGDSRAEKKLTVDCSVGSVEITFLDDPD